MQHYTTTLKGAKYEVFCLSADTRNGFKHEVELQKNGFIMAKAKICYLNRTWERYTYESAIHKAVDGAKFSQDKAENEKIKRALNRQFDYKALPREWRKFDK